MIKLVFILAITALCCAKPKPFAAPNLNEVKQKCADKGYYYCFAIGTDETQLQNECLSATDPTKTCTELVAIEKGDTSYKFTIIRKAEAGVTGIGFTQDGQQIAGAACVVDGTNERAITTTLKKWNIGGNKLVNNRDGLDNPDTADPADATLRSCQFEIKKETELDIDSIKIKLDGTEGYQLVAADATVKNGDTAVTEKTRMQSSTITYILNLTPIWEACKEGNYYYCFAIGADVTQLQNECLSATDPTKTCTELVAIEKANGQYNFNIIRKPEAGLTGIGFAKTDQETGGIGCHVIEATNSELKKINGNKLIADLGDELQNTRLDNNVEGTSTRCYFELKTNKNVKIDNIEIKLDGTEGYKLVAARGTVDDQAAVTIDKSIPSVATYLKDLDTDQQYKDCTDSSNCLVLKKSTTKADYTDACIGTTDCDLTVAFMRDGNKYSFTATAPLTGNGWVAVGFSNDSHPMTNNQAVACIQKAGGLTLDKIAIVDGSNVQKLGNADNITLNNVELTADGFIVFSFSVDEAVSFDQMQMNFSMFGDPIFLMGAAGPLNDDGNLQKHTLNVISPESFINVPFYGTCGEEGVKCVGNTANESNNADQCIEERNCMFGISYVKVKEENEEDKFTFETLASASNDYISIQFSNGDSKADDPVIVCNVKSDVNVSLLVTDEDGNYVAGNVADDAISSQESKSRDGHFNCGFTLKKNTNVKDGQTLKLGQNSGYNLIISTGTINDKGILSETDSIRTEKKYLNSGVSLSISVPLIFLLSYITVKFC